MDSHMIHHMKALCGPKKIGGFTYKLQMYKKIAEKWREASGTIKSSGRKKEENVCRSTDSEGCHSHTVYPSVAIAICSSITFGSSEQTPRCQSNNKMGGKNYAKKNTWPVGVFVFEPCET